MGIEEINLRQIFQYGELAKLFRHFAVTTGYDVALYDLKGEEQLSHRLGVSICTLATDRSECVSYIRYSAEKSRQLGEPYIYTGACGLILCCIPVVFRETLIGSIICGPVMLWDADELANAEIKGRTKGFIPEALEIDVSGITQTSCTKLTSAINILLVLVNYICAQAEQHLDQKLELAKQQEKLIRLAAEKQNALASMKVMEQHMSFRQYPAELEKELIAYVQLGDRTKAVEILNSFLGEIFSYASGDLNIIQAKLYEFTAFLSRATVEAGVPLSRLMDTVKKAGKLLDANIEFADLCSLLVEVLNEFIDCIFENRGKRAASLHLTRAIAYLQEHYAENLTLGDLAGKVFVSGYYLSHLFRDEMQTTFSEYLNKVRIEQAKQRLKEKGQTVERVSEEVGFKDPNYFIKAFKKSVGITPAKYKKIWS